MLMIRWTLSPARDQFGRISGIVCMGEDAGDTATSGTWTAAETIRGDTVSLQKKMMLLLSDIRHDINNKLTILSGYSQLIALENISPEARSYVAVQDKAIADISMILAFTKDYQRIGAEKPSWQDAGAVFALAATKVNLKGIRLENEVSGLLLYADPLLENVFFSIIENALEHGRTTTAIHAAVRFENGSVRITIEDNGEGIREDLKERIFSRNQGKKIFAGLFLSREILAVTGIGIREAGMAGKGAVFEIRAEPGLWRKLELQD
jgi:signal transduction histidine kinase